MKKIILGLVLVFSIGLLAGCQGSTATTDFDNADSETFDQATDTDASDIENPPVPPEPVEAE